MILKPTNESLARFIRETLEHCIRVEYYLYRLNVGKFDVQRPHDINGPGNKLELEENSLVLLGFAAQYNQVNSPIEFIKRWYGLHNSIKIHRDQDHHRLVSTLYHKQKLTLGEIHILKLAAVDAICSRMENRAYQDDINSYEELERVINEAGHKGHEAWTFSSMKELMKGHKAPNFESMKSLRDILKNLDQFELYDKKADLSQRYVEDFINDKIEGTIKTLVDKFGYDKNILWGYT